jgi:hypothetical protein
MVYALVLLVDGTHQRRCRRQYFVNKNEDSLLWRKLDAFADDIDKLAYCQILAMG